jgi:hypothetical protein
MTGIEIEFHTDDEKLQELCRKYWAHNTDGKFLYTVASLSASFDVPVWKMATTVAKCCVAYDSGDLCSRCKGPQRFNSRSDFLTSRSGSHRSRYWNGPRICPTCIEAERLAKEHDLRGAVERTKSVIVRELEKTRRKGWSTDRLSFRDAVYLISLLRARGAEDLSFITPLDCVNPAQLSPTQVQDQEILAHLYRRGLTCIHPESRTDSVVIVADELTEFYPAKVHWILPISDGGPPPTAVLEALEGRLKSEPWPEEWHREASQLQRDIALQECLQYLQVVMSDHGFGSNHGEKTCSVLRAVLNTFSIGQTYSFIWRAAKDAASFFLRENVTRAHAANIVPGAIQRMAERAIAENWQTSSFRRDFRAPLSVLSHVLFTTALQLPDGGFTTVPPPERGSSTTAGC